jgi:hypothetical protein
VDLFLKTVATNPPALSAAGFATVNRALFTSVSAAGYASFMGPGSVSVSVTFSFTFHFHHMTPRSVV